MKKFLTSAALVAASVPAVCFAEGEGVQAVAPTITPIVDVSGLQNNLLTTIQPWITAGLSIGLVVFAVYVGYRMIRKFTR